MKRFVIAVLFAGALAAGAPAYADPPPPWDDPHIPDRSHGSCPGGTGGFGVGWCDGIPYPDGTYWHQITWSGQYSGSGGGKPVCMGPDHNPAPPGGCGGYG